MRLFDLVVAHTNTRLREAARQVESREHQVAARLLAHRRLKRLVEYLAAYPSQRLDTETAARLVCFQKNYFCALFKRETGCTFASWQRTWRVVRIAEVLLSEDVLIMHAAERYGYLNLRAFERAFKEVYGMSAREFRREFRSKAAEPDKARRKLKISLHILFGDLGARALEAECASHEQHGKQMTTEPDTSKVATG